MDDVCFVTAAISALVYAWNVSQICYYVWIPKKGYLQLFFTDWEELSGCFLFEHETLSSSSRTYVKEPGMTLKTSAMWRQAHTGHRVHGRPLQLVGDPVSKQTNRGSSCRDGSAVQSTCCSCRGPGSVPSAHIMDHKHLCLQFQGIHLPSFELWGLLYTFATYKLIRALENEETQAYRRSMGHRGGEQGW